jgi:hypothetical protein
MGMTSMSGMTALPVAASGLNVAPSTLLARIPQPM